MGGRVLLIAFHFPPIQASSGVLRVVSLARHLGEFGWDVSVVTAKPGTYSAIREENYGLIPGHVEVIRTAALDVQRDLSVRGRYPTLLSLPDRWQSWIPSATVAGLRAIRRNRIRAILSTFPIASAHCVALALSRLTGLPWVADFRDPMAQETYPPDPRIRRALHWVEDRVARRAAAITVTTPGTAEIYRARYAGRPVAGRVHVIANGFDDEVLEQARSAAVPARPDGARLMLLHSGVLSPLERNPENLFLALADLKREGLVSARTLEVVLRASGGEDGYHRRLAELDIADVVRLEPPVPYRDALAEICAADGLLLLQTVGCNAQIPAKAYEYLVARRPILGLVDPAGDTGRLLERVGVRDIAALEDRDRVRRALGNFLAGLRRGDVRVPEEAQTARLSRRARAAEMAAVLDEVGSV